MVRRAVSAGVGLQLEAALELELELAMEIAVSDEARSGAAQFAQRKQHN